MARCIPPGTRKLREKLKRQGTYFLGMAPIDTIKLKAKGHLVIPAELREGFKEGEELVAIRDETSLTLKQASSLSEQEREDLEVARRIEEARKRYERGEFKSLPFDEFIERMKTW